MKFKTLFAVAASALVLTACAQVDTGQRGIETNFGEVVATHKEGLVWYNPITTDLEIMSVRQQKLKNKTSAYTKDVQQADIKYTMTYNLDPAKAAQVYQTVGHDWQDRLIPQVVEQTVKDVFGQSEAVKDVINDRGKVQGRILELLKVRLARRGIIVDGFELNDVSFSAAFEKAVEAKQVAVENANAAKNRTVQVEEESKQVVIKAEAEAEAMRIKSAALAGNPELTQFEAVKAWDGKLPVYMFGNNTPMINLNK